MRGFYPVLAAVGTLACSDFTPIAPASVPMSVSSGGVQAAKADRNVTDVLRFADGSVVAGASSTLVRTDQGVSMTLRTSDLEPGAAYTVWWVVFNNPGECATAPCGEPDLFDPDVMGFVTHAAGHLIAPNGIGNFAGHLREGAASDNLLGGIGSLMDALAAEIHIVVRSHGPALPGHVDEQIHTFEGACQTNACEDLQFAIHEP